MILKKALCEAVVDGWAAGWPMGKTVTHAWRLIDKTPETEIEKYYTAAEALKVKRIPGEMSTRVWVAQNMRRTNELLWGGAQRDACIAAAKKELGLNRTGARLIIKARERDTRHDWKTTK